MREKVRRERFEGAQPTFGCVFLLWSLPVCLPRGVWWFRGPWGWQGAGTSLDAACTPAAPYVTSIPSTSGQLNRVIKIIHCLVVTKVPGSGGQSLCGNGVTTSLRVMVDPQLTQFGCAPETVFVLFLCTNVLSSAGSRCIKLFCTQN